MFVLFIDGQKIGEEDTVKPLIEMFTQYAQADPFSVATFINLEESNYQLTEAGMSKED